MTEQKILTDEEIIKQSEIAMFASGDVNVVECDGCDAIMEADVHADANGGDWCPYCENQMIPVHFIVLRHADRLFDELAECPHCTYETEVLMWEDNTIFAQACSFCGRIIYVWREPDDTEEWYKVVCSSTKPADPAKWSKHAMKVKAGARVEKPL
jgi:Zn ribbon nucleic-acid-binding protein